MGSTGDGFKLFNVLPIEIVYKQVPIFLTIKYIAFFIFFMRKSKKKGKARAFDVKIIYYNIPFCQKLIDYLGPDYYYNSMPLGTFKKTHILLNRKSLKLHA